MEKTEKIKNKVDIESMIQGRIEKSICMPIRVELLEDPTVITAFDGTTTDISSSGRTQTIDHTLLQLQPQKVGSGRSSSKTSADQKIKTTVCGEKPQVLNVTVIGATGKIGSGIVKEFSKYRKQSIHVTALVRDVEKAERMLSEYFEENAEVKLLKRKGYVSLGHNNKEEADQPSTLREKEGGLGKKGEIPRQGSNGNSKGLSFIEGDLANPEVVAKAVENADIVFYCASSSSDCRKKWFQNGITSFQFHENRPRFLEYLYPKRIAEMCAKNDAHFVYFSSLYSRKSFNLHYWRDSYSFLRRMYYRTRLERELLTDDGILTSSSCLPSSSIDFLPSSLFSVLPWWEAAFPLLHHLRCRYSHHTSPFSSSSASSMPRFTIFRLPLFYEPSLVPESSFNMCKSNNLYGGPVEAHHQAAGTENMEQGTMRSLAINPISYKTLATVVVRGILTQKALWHSRVDISGGNRFDRVPTQSMTDRAFFSMT